MSLNDNYGGGFCGDGNGWWIILFFIVLFGWGGNGRYGNNGGGGVADGYVLTSDFANIERKLDGINNGICDSTFALNNSIKDGFSSAELSRCNQQAAFMQQLFSLSQQLSDCCCNNEKSIMQLRYDVSTQDCATRNLIQTTARDVIDNANSNSKAILDFLVNDRMRQLESENQSLKLAASQERQNNYIVTALRQPTPIPAYMVQNPYCCNQPCCGG